jgi:hypothetical protein
VCIRETKAENVVFGINFILKMFIEIKLLGIPHPPSLMELGKKEPFSHWD